MDQYNADARLWRKLAPKRRARRRLLRKVVRRKRLKEIDLQEFAAARPPQDCIGEWSDQSVSSSDMRTPSVASYLEKLQSKVNL